jgi:type I restriction enzyme R subunit
MGSAVGDPEYVQVEEPLIRQLEGMGWTHLAGSAPEAPRSTDPRASGRDSFAEVFLRERLRKALHAINLGADGAPWLKAFTPAQVKSPLARKPYDFR